MNSFAFFLLSLVGMSVGQRFLGRFQEFYHDVDGDVYVMDEGTIFIHNFVYDGQVRFFIFRIKNSFVLTCCTFFQGPDAFFYASNAGETVGYRIPDPERWGEAVLRSYRGEIYRAEECKWLCR